MSRASSSLFLFAAVAACSGPSATLVVTTGGEDPTTTFTQNPAVATIVIDSVVRGGGSTPIVKPFPYGQSTTIDLGDISQETVTSVQFNGMDANNHVVVFGATPNAELGALSGNVPLFVQRRGQFARLPGVMPDGRSAPFLAITNTNLYVAGGTIDGASGNPPLASYDLLNLGPSDTLDAPQAATSFALIQFAQQTEAGDYAAALWLDASGETLIGLNETSAYPPFDTNGSNPVPIDCSPFAGGPTVIGDDNTAYVVGAGRTSSPSSAILALSPTPDANGNPVVNTATSAPRQGAAVVWVPGTGVFIWGGSSDTQYAAGELIEVAEGSLKSVPLTGYPPDPTQGLAAIATTPSPNVVMLLAGDANPPRTVDLGCSGQTCTIGTNTFGPALPTALASPALFALDTTPPKFMIIGDDANGNTLAFVLDGTNAPVAVPFQIARKGARGIQTLLGAVLIVGGGSNVIESYVP